MANKTPLEVQIEMGDFFNKLQWFFELLDMKPKIEALPRGPYKDWCKWQWREAMKDIVYGRKVAA